MSIHSVERRTRQNPLVREERAAPSDENTLRTATVLVSASHEVPGVTNLYFDFVQELLLGNAPRFILRKYIEPNAPLPVDPPGTIALELPGQWKRRSDFGARIAHPVAAKVRERKL